MAEICHYESIYRHSAAGPFHLNYWFVHLFACLCASLGQIVSATFDEGVHLAVRKETWPKKKSFCGTHSSVCPAPFLRTNFCFCIRIVRGLFVGLAQMLMESVCEVILISMRIPSTALLPLTFLTLLDCFGLIRLHWFPHMPLHARTHMNAHIHVHTHTFIPSCRSWHICYALVWEFEQCAKRRHCAQRLLL